MVKTVFLIDDDEDDRDIFQEAVREFDPTIKVAFAQDGHEAVEVLLGNKIRPDIIFLDFNMPRMNGVECLKVLKQNQDTRSIPTIMYSTLRNLEQEKMFLQLGADHYMAKTVRYAELCEEIKRLIKLFVEKE